MDSSDAGGKVFLIGAGPGDPGLLTLRGARIISLADVVVYDRLAHPRILDRARSDARRIYVGKAPGHQTLAQEEINRLLIDHARAGSVVARIKGGDPFVFGRGAEEAEALVRAGVSFEVIPGVTSAVAAPAYAGIPLTERGVARSFAVVTGHTEEGAGNGQTAWERLARGVDTLVVLMGVAKLPEIARALIQGGRSSQTPSAAIQWGTLGGQLTVTGTLATLPQQVQAAGLDHPAVIVVGEVVRLREKLAWFEKRPLAGRRVLVTRPLSQAADLAEKLEALGADALVCPLIRIVPPEDDRPLDAAIKNLPSYDWIIFTSENALSAFFQRLEALRMDSRALGGAKIAALGPATAAGLLRHGITADFVPSRFVSEAFAAEFPASSASLRALIPQAEAARDTIAAGLKQRGVLVEAVTAYRTLPEPESASRLHTWLSETASGILTLTSASAAHALAGMLQAPLSDTVRIISIGPATSAAAKDLGISIHAEADPHTSDGVVAAVLSLSSAVEP